MIGVVSSKRSAVIRRAYETEEKACAQAVELLLKKPLTSKRAAVHTPDNGSDDGTKYKEASADAVRQ